MAMTTASTLSVWASQNRPRVMFNCKNILHMEAYANFLTIGRWVINTPDENEQPMLFILTPPYVDLPKQIATQIAIHHLNGLLKTDIADPLFNPFTFS